VNSTTLRATQEFFAARAAGWEERFPDDDPRFEQAILELAPPAGGCVLDAGCGTGRALRFLRRAVGHSGLVVGLDVTPEMISEARCLGRHSLGVLLVADGEQPPFRDRTFDAIFAAGFVPHLNDPQAGLAELARITVPGGRLAIFHPIGRAPLAARHGHTPSDNDVVAPVRLMPLLESAGWALESIDDGPKRYIAIARRA
jgi:SAM-dependent methyltransferase